MRLPDPGQMLGLPGVLARPLARRATRDERGHGRAGRAVRHLHYDAAGDPEAYDPRMWAWTGCTPASAATG